MEPVVVGVADEEGSVFGRVSTKERKSSRPMEQRLTPLVSGGGGEGRGVLNFCMAVVA